MRDTPLDPFVDVSAEDWIDEAAEVYGEVAPILRRVAGKQIVAHEILGGGLRRTTFEGGFEVLVNYSSEPRRTRDGRVIGPLSYAAGYAAGSAAGYAAGKGEPR
jgi:hypothetical protein